MTIPFFSRARRSDEGSRPATRVLVPKDAAAIAVGADGVAAAIARSAAAAGQALEMVRTGSRGMMWLEPLVEVESAACAMASVRSTRRTSMLWSRGGLLRGDASRFQTHRKYLGPVDKIGYLARQTRLTFVRCGVIDPLSLDARRSRRGSASGRGTSPRCACAAP